MSSKLLKKLMSESDKESRKKAEKLLNSGSLLYVYEEDNILKAVFQDNKSGRINSQLSINEGQSECECKDGSSWCIHKSAIAMHYLKCNDMLSGKTVSIPNYGGLKTEPLHKLLSSNTMSSGRLEVWIEKQPPHAPSKWANVLVTVKIFDGKREYSGNLNNIRQLNFGKGIGSGFNIEAFSSQEKQIIRFLSLNSEPDGKKLLLDAETVSEFFHCLIDFKNCYYNETKSKKTYQSNFKSKGIIRPLNNIFYVHGETSEVVLSYSNLGEIYKLQPALLTGNSLKPLKNFRMLSGRSGCWIGIESDYWWQPGKVDLIWLRSFMLSGSGKYPDNEAMKIIANADKNGIKVIKSRLKNTLSSKKCIPSYSYLFDENNRFHLFLNFVYGDQIFKPGGVNTYGNGKYSWKRDRKIENAFETELIFLGFIKESDKQEDSFILDSPETAGLFLDKTVPKWYAEKREMLFSSDFSVLINNGRGIPELKLSCSIIDPDSETVELAYSISAGNIHNTANWKEICNLIKKGKKYLFKKDLIIAKTDQKLIEFVTLTSDFTNVDNEKEWILKIPKSTLLYWGEKYEKLTELLPISVKELQAELHTETRPLDSIPKSFDNKEKSENSFFIGTLRSYQEEGVEWIRKMSANNLNSILADEMGLGKTVQAIALLCKNKEESVESQPSFVLCPSSLVENWQMEFAKFAPELKVIILMGANRHSHYADIENLDIVITSYNIAGRDIEKLKKIRFNYLILDEAQHIKNPSTVNAVTSKTIKAKYKLVLTGTPLENTPSELWSIFDFLHPKMLGSLNAFKNRYAGIHNDESMQHDLAVRTAPFMLRRKKDEVEPDLPAKVIQTIYCDMNSEQRSFYEDFRQEGVQNFGKLVKSGKNSRFDLLTNLLRLRQICCHPDLINKENEIISAKTELLQELLMESIDSGHKVLVFSQFTSFLAIIRKWLLEKQINFEYLDGSTKDRLDRVNNFNDSSDIPIFLLSLKAGGVGLNLTSADRVIIYDPWWNPAVEAQATDRTHRIGQKKNVYSMKLVVKDSIEEKILKLQEKKQKIFQNLVENQSASLKTLSDEDIEFLLG